MPTALARTQITHREPIQRALSLAAQRWPDERPGALLTNLICLGAASIEGEVVESVERRRQQCRGEAGSFPGIFGPGYLEEAREGWPE